MVPIEPPESAWEMPDPAIAGEGDLVAVGADLAPGTVLAAYRQGIFPMPVDDRLAWWSPAQRAILPLDALRVSRSLRRSCRRYELRIDTAFEDVIDECADPRRRGGWIDPGIRSTYVELHRLGWAHSVEAYEDGELVGGLYGVSIGGLFAGESMFHRRVDASKVALVGLVERLQASEHDHRLLDVQWLTPHLQSLGAIEVDRDRYLALLKKALRAGAAFG